MLRKIAFGAGAAMAALGLAAAAPMAASAAPSPASASAASDQVTVQGTWVYIQPYAKSQTGALKCTVDARSLNNSTGRPYNCRTKTDRIELWSYYG
ncbi:hypothetical protein GCM10022222_27800 [Amycolatopsis ultiminotia]|uniref:Uncharacterized protein n=1 Tax=Amycolatopsis ultiminotia TaxID=543629 RepID=A0ABP6VWC1_9PSEU